MNGKDMVPTASHHGHNEGRGMHHIRSPIFCHDRQQDLLKHQSGHPGSYTQVNHLEVGREQAGQSVAVFPIYIDPVLVLPIDFPQMKDQLNHIPVNSRDFRQQSCEVKCNSSNSIMEGSHSCTRHDGILNLNPIWQTGQREKANTQLSPPPFPR